MRISNGVKKLKIIIASLLLISLVLIGASCGEGERRKSRDEYEEEEEYLTYENQKWGFEIKYPEDWEKEEEDSSVDEFAVVFTTPPEDENDTVKENLLIYASTAQPDDFDELMGDLIEDLSGDSYVTLLGYSKIMVSGHPGYKVSYTYSDYYSEELGEQSLQYLHYFINAGDFWYQVLYVALESTYSKYLDQAETMIDSLDIK